MKSTGIVRKVDELGRVVIPIELRRVLGIDIRDSLEIFVEDDLVVLRKFEPACSFCGSSEDNIIYMERRVCKECIGKMGKAESGR